MKVFIVRGVQRHVCLKTKLSEVQYLKSHSKSFDNVTCIHFICDISLKLQNTTLKLKKYEVIWSLKQPFLSFITLELL
jgi:hypothetical protein